MTHSPASSRTAAPAKRIKRARLACTALAVIALSALGLATPALATPVACFDENMSPLPCDDPMALLCFQTTMGITGPSCPVLNYTQFHGNQGASATIWRCDGGIPGCGVTEVPELEEYAAAAFLLIALTIGWRARQRYTPAA